VLEIDDGKWEGIGRVYRALAELSIRDGDLEAALAILRSGLARLPGREGLLYMQANVLMDLGHEEAAVESL
jgi:hypothetical protein